MIKFKNKISIKQTSCNKLSTEVTKINYSAIKHIYKRASSTFALSTPISAKKRKMV